MFADVSMLEDLRLGWGPIPEDPRQRGAWAEAKTAWRYRLCGWRVVARNWHGGGGELDVVCARWRTLTVIEVRQRKDFLSAAVSVDEEKMRRTKRAGQAFVQRFELQQYHLRYDLVLVDGLGHLDIRRNLTKS